METNLGNAAQGAATVAKPQAPVETPNTGITAKETPKETPKDEANDKPQKYKLVRKGQEVEVDAETYHRYAQKAHAADMELAEAKKVRREAEEQQRRYQEAVNAIEAAKKQPASARVKSLLEELQDDPSALNEFRGSVEAWLVDRLKEESASPELQRALKAERELEKAKRDQEAAKKRAEQEAWQKQVEANKPIQEKFIIDTLNLSGLPPTEWNVKSVADVLYNSRLKGHKPSPEQIATIVKEDRIDNIRALGGGISAQILEANKSKDYSSVVKLGGQLTEMFGEDILKALRVYDIRKHQSAQPELPKPVVETQHTEKKAPGSYEFKNMDEWQEARRRAVQSMIK